MPRGAKTSCALVLTLAFAGFGCNAVSGIGDFEVTPESTDAAPGDGSAADGTLEAAADVENADVGNTDGGIASEAGDAASDAPFDGNCPNKRGPSPVLISNAYCIDSTEVTNADYAKFVSATNGDAGTQPSYCSWNTTTTPPMGWPAPGSKKNNPVTYVNWCNASLFCQWSGKRLCGQIGGGPWSDHTNEGADQWYQACSKGASQTYPYGNTYKPMACNGADDGNSGTVAAGSSSQCVGGFSGLLDMSGNVSEWLDGCDQSTGTGDACPVRGGSYTSTEGDLVCSWTGSTQMRGYAGPDVGFRCCAP